jgi:hypothetical protein
MCLLANHPNNRRYRTLLALGSLCLSLALTSQALSLSFGLPVTPLHFLRGLFLGISIAISFGAVVAGRRTSREQNR